MLAAAAAPPAGVTAAAPPAGVTAAAPHAGVAAAPAAVWPLPAAADWPYSIAKLEETSLIDRVNDPGSQV